MRGLARSRSMLRRVLWLATIPSCGGASKAGPPPASSVTPAAASPGMRPPVTAPPPVPAGRPYRTALVGALRSAFRGEIVDPGSSDVVVLRQRGRKKRDIVVTAGLGRAPRSGEAPRVELVAHVPEYAPGVGEVLVTLASRLESLRAYEAVQLETPVRSLRYFDLLPGGEVKVLGEPVRLYRVVPLTPDEFENAAESHGSQWVGSELPRPDAAVQALERWGPALGRRE